MDDNKQWLLVAKEVMAPYTVNATTGNSLCVHYLHYLLDYECKYDRLDPSRAGPIAQRIMMRIEGEKKAAREKAEREQLRKLGILQPGARGAAAASASAQDTIVDGVADEVNKALFGLTTDATEDTAAAALVDEDADADAELPTRNGELKEGLASNEFAYRGVHGALLLNRKSNIKSVGKHLLQSTAAGPSQRPTNPVARPPANDSASFCPDPNASRAFTDGDGIDDPNAYLSASALGDDTYGDAGAAVGEQLQQQQQSQRGEQMDYSDFIAQENGALESTPAARGSNEDEQEVQVMVDEEGRVVRVLDGNPGANDLLGDSPPIAIPPISSSGRFGMNTAFFSTPALHATPFHGSNPTNASAITFC